MPKIPVPPSLNLDAHVRRVFKRFNLDPDDLQDWHTLLLNIAGGRPGAPLKWNAWELCKLRMMVDLLHHLRPNKSDAKCCQELSRNKGHFRFRKGGSTKGYYEGINPGTLRRRLQDARKPAMRVAYENFCEVMRRTT
jgi:hypothetical protein